MFHVDWDDPALDMLADLCLRYQHRWADINGAVDSIEFRLQRDPLSLSRHIAEELRRIDSSPLAVYFSVAGTRITIESVRRVE
jgi:hypothetical protein